MNLNGKAILITGGTGSFGQTFVAKVLKKYKVKKLIVFSRDEYKQMLMQKRFSDKNIRFFLGDIRDASRLHRALHGVDIIVHAAALKQVPALEYNPFEAVRTNIIGAENIINCAIDNRVKQVIALSSDKAVNPINLYGATKLCADKIFVAGNSYSGESKTLFSVVRYGNVINSRGSVIPVFEEQKKKGAITITDKRMTRFWMTLDQGTDFVLKCIDIMKGGEIFIPKLPSMKILDLAEAIAPGCKHRFIGIRPGEKLHEALIPDDESHNTIESKHMFIIQTPFKTGISNKIYKGFKQVKDGFKYTSDTNKKWLSIKDIRKMINN